MTDVDMKEIFEKGLFKGEIKFDEPLSAHTSLRIGGPVDIMVFPEDPVSLKNVLAAAHRENIPVHVIGGGTNLLAGDGRVGGIAVSLRAFSNIENTRETTEDHVVLYAGAGVPLAALVNFSRRNGYSGIEALSGIPGYLGGAVYMNAGSFGTEIKDVIVSVAVMNMQGDISIMDRDSIAFSYRSSNLPEGLLILSANIRLKKDRPEDVDRRANEFLARKRASQPMGGLSAGCVFKNPGADSAGRLIDAAGCKGMRVGAVEVSAVHANYFINKGGASARDFIELMDVVRERVRENSGIELEPEIKFINT